MDAQRIFFVTQSSLSIWVAGDRVPERIAVFSGDNGLREFDSYISLTQEHSAVMLVDVIEEEFDLETVPKLGARDRNALIARRRERKYRRTPYRASEYLGKVGHGSDECRVLHSAITNGDLLAPWMGVILKHRVALAGVFSVPMMAPGLFARLFSVSGPALFIAPHQDSKLRQVYIRKGSLLSARLSRALSRDDDGYANFIVTETQKSRRYLERMRLLNNMEVLEVCVIADGATAERVRELSVGELSVQFSFVEPDVAAGKLLGCDLPRKGRFEIAYLASILKRRPKRSYAGSGENRYWKMQSARHAIMGVAAAVAAVCSVSATYFFLEAWRLHGDVSEIRTQVELLTDTYRTERDNFAPVLAGSHVMKLAVDTGDFILRNRLPLPWVMNQVSAVLGDYPEVEVRELGWSAGMASSGTENRRRNRPKNVSIPEVQEVGAWFAADITPFDGDMRKAFARIDQLAADLRSETHFTEAAPTEYPLNADPEAAVSGEISLQPDATASFSIRATYDAGPASTGGDR